MIKSVAILCALAGLVLATQGFAQQQGEVEETGQPAGTVLRTWLSDTSINWVPGSQSFDVKPGLTVNWSGALVVNRIQTKKYTSEVVTNPARNVWEKTGTTYTSERDPTCETFREQDPPDQKRECPFVETPHDSFGWIPYPQETAQQDAGSQDDAPLESRTMQVSVRLSGQKLRSFETESLSVSVDENAAISAWVNDAKNTYQVSAQTISPHQAVVVLTGQGRALSGDQGVLPESIFAEGGTPKTYQSSQDPNRVYIQFKLSDQIFNGQDDPNAQLKVTYQIWQTSGAKDTDNYQAGASRSVMIDAKNNKDVQIDLWGAGRGRWVKAKVFFNIAGSQWYSERTFDTEAEPTQSK